MKSLTRSATTAITALLLSLFVGMPAAMESAHADATVTKTINVKDANGAALANALVAVGYPDTNSADNWHWTDPVTTNSSGQAVISGLPVSSGYSEMYVEPAVSDSLDAFGFVNSDAGTFSLTSSSVVNINLKAASVHLNITESNGTPAPVHTWIAYPSNSSQNYWPTPNLLRTGSFGLAIDPSLDCDANGGNWSVQFGYGFTDISNLDTNFSMYHMIATGCNPNRTLTFKNALGQDAPQSNGVFQINSNRKAFAYTIVSPTDSTTAVLNHNAWMEACITIDNNDQCVSVGDARGPFGLPDGTYKIRLHPGDAPYSTKNYTVTIGDGGTSYSAKVGSPSTGVDVPTLNGRLVFALGPINISGTITKPNGDPVTLTGNQGFVVELLKDDGHGNYQYQNQGFWSQGSFAYNITDVGNYKIEVRPQGLIDFVNTRSPVITATDSGGIKLSWGGGSAVSTLSHNIAVAVPTVIFNVLNPNTQESMTAGWVTMEKMLDNNGNRNWYGNLDIDYNYPGRAAGSLEDGTYLATVNPPQGSQSVAGLASKQYVLVVASNGTSLTLHKGNTVNGDVIAAGPDGHFTVTPGAANVVGRFLDGGGNGVGSNNTSWVNACLQQLRNDGVNWDYLSCSQTTSTGAFSMSVSNPGTFRVYLEPQGRSDIAATTLARFTVTNDNLSTFKQDYGNVTAASPTLKIRVREAGGSTNVQFAGIEIRKDNQFVQWVNTLQSGVVAVNLATAGAYQFIVNPTDQTPNSTRSTYDVTATAGNDGSISAAVTGVTADGNGILTLNLGTAQIHGHVLLPIGQGDTGVANAWVVAVDKSSNQEMWQYGSNSQRDGSFAMSLPAGTYTLYAHSPYGDVSMGNSDPIGDLTVSTSGAVTIAGAAQTAGDTADNFIIRMQNPYWSGKVLPPSGSTGVSNARVCLNATVNGVQFWNCANTDNDGNWAMGKPAGFTDFGPNDQIQIAENQNAQYSMAAYQGKTDIESSGFLHTGAGSLNLRLAAPNFVVKIVYGQDSAPASNLWVNVNKLAGGWIGGSSTDANGYAKFTVSDLTKGVQVMVDPSNNPTIAAVAASVNKQYQDNQMSGHVSGGNFADTITLASPNIRGTVTDPTTNATVANSWVELLDNSTNNWITGSNTSPTGFFALNVPSGTYRLNVNPPWNGTSATTNHSYTVVIDGGGNVTSFINRTNNVAVDTITFGTGAAYPLTLGTPSVVGKVVDPTNAYVQNSWVVPTDIATNNQMWQLGSNSHADGSFNMAVPDGSYTIQANAPWNSSAYSSSASCSITIVSGAVVTSPGGCVGSDHKLTLSLRAPNLSVTVRDSNGIPLQNAHVGIGVGSWNANAQTDASGVASLFVDPAAINTANNGRITGAQNITMWIDPPYGNSNVVRSQCYSGQAGTACASLAQVTPGNGSFSAASITTNLQAPNTSVTIKLPDGTTSAGANAWVSIISIIKNGSGQEIGRNWLGGSNTDSDGRATFNLVDTSLAYVVQIEAPWNQRDLYAGAIYDSNTTGLTWSLVNGHSFALRSPNLTMAVRTNDSSASISGGWLSVESANVSNQPTGWIGGYGLDQNGKVSLTLDANGRFKITTYPAPGVVGVPTSCIVTTNGSAIVSLVSGQCGTGNLVGTTITLPLANGNVTGVVTIQGTSTPVIGAIVSANYAGSTDTSTLVITSTDKNGTYNLQLDPSHHWDITVTPVNTPADLVRLAAKTLGDQTVQSSLQTISVTVNPLS